MNLTESELNRIFSWQPYRDNWEVDLRMTGSGADGYYTDFDYDLRYNGLFEVHCSQDGGLTNYLEYICYAPDVTGKASCIIVRLSLCAPIGTYGQGQVNIEKTSLPFAELTNKNVLLVEDESLKKIELKLNALFRKSEITILDSSYLSQNLPNREVTALSLHKGSTYLQGIFQWID